MFGGFGSYGGYQARPGGGLFEVAESLQYSSQPTSRRYGEGPKRLVSDGSRPNPLFDLFRPAEEETYEEWKWRTEFKGVYPEETLLKLKTNNPLWSLSGETEMIEVVVGEVTSPWAIHKSLLGASSTFFQVAINGLFREGREKKVYLKDEANEVFSLFVQWIYSGSFVTTSLPLLLRAYVLGDKLGSPRFQVYAFDRIYGMNMRHCYFTPEQAVWVSENTMPGSMLRTFTMDTIAFGLVNNTLLPSKDDWELMAPIYLQVLSSIQSLSKVENHTWHHKSRLYYVGDN